VREVHRRDDHGIERKKRRFIVIPVMHILFPRHDGIFGLNINTHRLYEGYESRDCRGFREVLYREITIDDLPVQLRKYLREAFGKIYQ
jgi:hypothetical protein